MDGKGTASLTQGLRSTLCIFVHGKVSKDTEMSIDFIGTSVLQDIQVIHIFAWKLKRKKDRKKERQREREREREPSPIKNTSRRMHVTTAYVNKSVNSKGSVLARAARALALPAS